MSVNYLVTGKVRSVMYRQVGAHECLFPVLGSRVCSCHRCGLISQEERANLEEQIAAQREKLKKAVQRLRSLKAVSAGFSRAFSCCFGNTFQYLRSSSRGDNRKRVSWVKLERR